MITKLTECVACGDELLYKFLDLNEQPLANNYHTGEPQQAYPLAVNYCVNCSHTQLTHAVDPKLLFENYLYVTGTSDTLRQYCKDFAKFVTDTAKVGAVLDIASNDGTQLSAFKDKGWDTYGVEPAKNLAKHSEHTIYCDFFENVEIDKKFDAITAQNVVAHTQYPLQFLKKIKKLLKPNGRAFIQTSQCQMYANGEFDTVYHEHISFFCVNSMQKLCHRAGLKLLDVVITPIHGNSYVFVIGKKGEEQIDQYLTDERYRYNFRTYEQFADKALTTVNDLKCVIEQYKSAGFTVAGYGAAAKGMTVLNAGDIQLDYIADDNPLKQNKQTPGGNIPIVPSDALRFADDMLIIPLAWNFYDEICDRVKPLRKNKNTVFVKYFPELKIHHEKFTG